MKRLAVLTSGGDAPGMNAAIRSVTRSALAAGFEVFGVRDGYTGLIAGEFVPFGPREVGGILALGGTMLGSSRCAELRTDAGQARALQSLAQHGIEALVVIGGNGSQSGACSLSARGLAVVGVASTIDNDLFGTDITIGATTAIDVALESVDRLRVTASSHRRGFLVEVMGRDCGYLAAMVGIAGGAEAICVPEQPREPEAVAAEIHAAYQPRQGACAGDRGRRRGARCRRAGAVLQVARVAPGLRHARVQARPCAARRRARRQRPHAGHAAGRGGGGASGARRARACWSAWWAASCRPRRWPRWPTAPSRWTWACCSWRRRWRVEGSRSGGSAACW